MKATEVTRHGLVLLLLHAFDLHLLNPAHTNLQ